MATLPHHTTSKAQYHFHHHSTHHSPAPPLPPQAPARTLQAADDGLLRRLDVAGVQGVSCCCTDWLSVLMRCPRPPKAGDQPPLAITPGHHHWLSPLPITSANHPWPSSMAITSGHHHWHSPLLGALAVTPLLGRQVMARPSAVRSWATDIIPVQCNTTVHCAQYTCALVHNLLHSTLPVLHHTYTPVTVGQTPLHLQLQ